MTPEPNDDLAEMICLPGETVGHAHTPIQEVPLAAQPSSTPISKQAPDANSDIHAKTQTPIPADPPTAIDPQPSLFPEIPETLQLEPTSDAPPLNATVSETDTTYLPKRPARVLLPKIRITYADLLPPPPEESSFTSSDADDDDQNYEPAETNKGSGWTIPFLCAGLALIACCILIPQADENRRIAYECAKLRLDLEQIKSQVKTNDEFVRRAASDPTLSERLAQRQMKYIRAGTRVLPLSNQMPDEISPFGLVNVPMPAALPPYQPIGGKLSVLCRTPRAQLYLIGLGLMLAATGLVLGFSPRAHRLA